jgi:gliding motility-associated-like protein
VKDNLNLEKLFKEKFDSFEGEVRPDLWTNIQQGINLPGAGTAVAAKTGMSMLVKSILISGGIIAASVVGIYLYNENAKDVVEETPVASNQKEGNVREIEVNNDPPIHESLIKVTDSNDPIISKNKESIEQELSESSNKNKTKALEKNDVDVTDQEKTEVQQTSTQYSGEDVTNKSDKQPSSAEIVIAEKDNIPTKKDSKDSEGESKDVDVKIPSGSISANNLGEYAPTTYKFVANAKNASKISWDFGDGKIGMGEEVEHEYTKPGKYAVRLQVFGETEIYEEVLEINIRTKSSIDNIPNVITPNGDRINEFFSIDCTEIETFYIAIRNDKGQLVFESNDKNFKWNGVDASGNTLPVSTCTYMIVAEGNDGSVFKIPGVIHIRK